MILVDTSVWVDHLRQGDALLASHLQVGRVATHPFVIGELALGSLRQRDTLLAMLGDLPAVTPARDDEVLGWIGRERLFGLGIGYVDAHLLAAIRLSPGVSLWTRDKRLQEVARSLGLPVEQEQ